MRLENTQKKSLSDRAGYKISCMIAKIEGRILKNGVEAYWWNFKVNSGDLVTPMLLKHYGFTPIHIDRDHATVLSCGSILQKVNSEFSGYILGSGLLNGENGCSFPKASIYALRGTLTRDKLKVTTDVVLGDPGLLVSRVYKSHQKKKYLAGIVPHYNNKMSDAIRKLCSRYPQNLLFIDVQREPLSVLSDIDKCESILSSSLHGLVFADSLGIPCTWIILEKNATQNFMFKYLDYNSAIQRNQEMVYIDGSEDLKFLINQASTPKKFIVEKVKDDLDSAFNRFKLDVGFRE